MKIEWLLKLRSQAGESIAETLIALLISSLALLMLAGAITAATRVVDRSKVAIKDYYVADNVLAAFKPEPTPGKNEIIVGNVKVLTGQTTVSIGNGDISQQFPNVNYYINNKLGGKDVISYVLPTPTATTPSGL